VEVDNAVAELPMANEMNLQPIKRGRSKNFSEEEDLMLVSAYMNVSKDLITGRDKKEGTFWERVWKYFNKNRTFESDRNWSSLKHLWLPIQKEVNIFQSYYVLTLFWSAKYSRRTGGGALWSGADGPRPGAGRSATWHRG
jgi:hypothetical protein